SYEVTTFRTESDYEDHRRPSSVSFVSSLREDLMRRDFTMNAIAMSVEGEIVDPFSGKNDLDSRLIRTVGRAVDRFQEDPLRMMRAIRFTSQLSFRIEKKTIQALEQLAHELQHISVERITAEFEKLLLGQDTGEAFRLLVDSGLFAYLPGLAERKDLLNRVAAFDLTSLEDLSERWALVCIILEPDNLQSWLRQWKLSNKSVNQIVRLKETVQRIERESWTPLLVYETGLETALSAEKVFSLLHNKQTRFKMIEQVYAGLPVKQRNELAVGGKDLLDWFQKKPGPWVAQQIEAIETAVIDGEIKNNKEAVRAWLQKRTF
ncbi:MAG TPA: CCA tRNA nucleotidyltransferase, partial [Bacillales bacterium]